MYDAVQITTIDITGGYIIQHYLIRKREQEQCSMSHVSSARLSESLKQKTEKVRVNYSKIDKQM
jgi:hypothetical protein